MDIRNIQRLIAIDRSTCYVRLDGLTLKGTNYFMTIVVLISLRRGGCIIACQNLQLMHFNILMALIIIYCQLQGSEAMWNLYKTTGLYV